VSTGEHGSKGGSEGPFGAALFRATLKGSPEDFTVHERLDIALDGAGEHLWLHIEKRGLDTWAVRDALAQAFGCTERDVGHAGLKDRHAVTRQWLSVRSGADPDADAAHIAALVEALGEGEGERPGAPSLRVLHSARHGRKLRIGAHRGNTFRIVLRHLTDPAGNPLPGGAGGEAPAETLAAALQQRVEQLRALGCPNRIGEQRFGRGGGNLPAARALLGGTARQRQRLTRRRRGLLLSAARSHLFNRVLDARIQRGDWHTLLPGEPAMLHGSRSCFVPEPDDADLPERLASLDVSPTGPLPGRGPSLARDACARFEHEVLSDETALIDGLSEAGVEVGRRALRVAVPDLTVEPRLDDGQVVFRFSLPPGSFATSLIELFGATRVADDPS